VSQITPYNPHSLFSKFTNIVYLTMNKNKLMNSDTDEHLLSTIIITEGKRNNNNRKKNEINLVKLRY